MRRIENIKTIFLIILLLMGMMLTFYGIRIEVKLTGMVVLLSVFGLLWMRNLENNKVMYWTNKDVHMILFMTIVTATAVGIVCYMLVNAGPQPFILYSPLSK